jgi:DNA polymerase-1
MARDCFVAGPGRLFVELDYSQIELRVAAMLSQDPEMIRIYQSGVDYHRRTAELVSKLAWGIDPSQVQDPHRTQAKTINFSTLYGAGIASIAAKLGVTYAQAERVVTAIMGHFKVLAAFIDACKAETRRTGYAWTWWAGQRARRRPLYKIADPEDGARITAENGSFNTPVQGTANEFCVASLADCVEWIEEDGLEEDARLVLPVHDSMLFEVREEMALEVAHHVRGIMLSHDSQGVPLEVDCKMGRAWGSLDKVPLADDRKAEAAVARIRGLPMAA